MQRPIIPLLLLVFFFILNQAIHPQDMRKINDIEKELKALEQKLLLATQQNDMMLKQIQEKIAALEQVKLKKEQEDELKKLLDEANKLTAVEKKEESGVGKKFYSGERQQSGLNPNISMSGDFFGAISSSKQSFISQPSKISYGNNRFKSKNWYFLCGIRFTQSLS